MANGQICRKYNCHRCCIETEMLLTKKDIKTITKIKGIDPEKYVKLTDDDFKMLRNRKHGDRYQCFFLDQNGLCYVYDNRPEGCQFYPLIWHLDNHEAAKDDYCPYNNEFEVNKEELGSLENFILKLFGRL
ncbi:MAG: YkgJ family cysteine cluster protein [Candidatus Hodarchaeales archaeon]|jgi:Fe-S-cluster containining protein